MAINLEDGWYALDCWIDPDSEGDADVTEYADEQEELEERAMQHLREGKYKWLSLLEWDDEAEEWNEIEIYSEEDLAA